MRERINRPHPWSDLGISSAAYYRNRQALRGENTSDCSCDAITTRAGNRCSFFADWFRNGRQVCSRHSRQIAIKYARGPRRSLPRIGVGRLHIVELGTDDIADCDEVARLVKRGILEPSGDGTYRVISNDTPAPLNLRTRQ